jgi:hypothetical protein
MKKRLLALSSACLVCLSALSYSSLAQTTPTPAVPNEPVGPHRGHHPAIRAAIAALERAKADMQAAAHDFGGHRVDALAACDNAIAQLRLALQYANANPAAPGGAPAPSTQ